MARRRIGQEHLQFGCGEASRIGSLDALRGLIDWAEIDRHLAPIYAAAKGEPAWPPLSLFKALLLAVWYDLSDVKLAEALDDRASFRCFCGFAAHEPTPERTAFVRFRREVLARGLDRVLFAAVTDQLDAQGVAVKTGTLVDATLIASSSVKTDDEAHWAGHRRKRPSMATRRISPRIRLVGWCDPLRSRRPTSTTGLCSRRCCRTNPARSMPITPTRRTVSQT
jgi:IS5 family transposase